MGEGSRQEWSVRGSGFVCSMAHPDFHLSTPVTRSPSPAEVHVGKTWLWTKNPDSGMPGAKCSGMEIRMKSSYNQTQFAHP